MMTPQQSHTGIYIALVFALAAALTGGLVLRSPRTVERHPAAASIESAETERKAGEAYGKLPLGFEENRGQSAASVDFLARGAGYSIALSSAEAVFTLSHKETSAVLRMRLAGADGAAAANGSDALEGRVNYFIGNDPAKWRTDIPTFARVRYAEVYPGIDVVYYGNQKRLEYDFVVAPGVDTRTIALEFAGAQKLEVDAATGDLLLSVGGETVRQHAPLTYQETAGGGRREVESRYELRDGGRVGFEVGEYDASAPLVIDPVLAYSTYLGGSGEENAYAIAVDSAGNTYVTGETNSTDFPVLNPIQGTRVGGPADGFVSKLNATGTALVYSTYFGGSNDGVQPDFGDVSTTDVGLGIAVDSAGNAYIAGLTNSTDFPRVNPIQNTFGGRHDGFVLKLNAAGSALVYSTFLGSFGYDECEGIALDSAGNAYVTGGTTSDNFPTLNPIQGAFGDSVDAFVTKINAAGSALVYSTLLGGDRTDGGSSIAVDPAGNAYVTGYVQSTDFPTRNPIQGTYGGGQNDVFVTKINAAGSALVYSTYLGGNDNDGNSRIAVDSAGNAYVTGYTFSTNFPLANPIQGTYGGHLDVFVTKINAGGTALAYSTYLGGNDSESDPAIAVDSAGNAYVTGDTYSTNFPTVNPVQGALASTDGSGDAFVTKFNAAGTALVYSTYLGGGDVDYGTAIAVDSAGSAYVIGDTSSASSACFPTTAGAYDSTLGGGGAGRNYDSFIFKLSETGTQPALNACAPTLSSLVEFSASGYSAEEDCTSVTITVNRTGDTSGAASVNYRSSDGTATERRDYITTLGKLQFAPGETTKTFEVLINEDSYTEGDERFTLRLSSPSGVSLGGRAVTTFTITDDISEPAANVIDDPRNFVCQNYHDFLNRQPDPSGWDFWTDSITSCGSNLGCVNARRVNVSAAFFLSIEFQQTGYLVERAYKATYGDANGHSTLGAPHDLPVPVVEFYDFLSDSQKITKGVIVLQPGWEQQLANNQQSFFAEFVQRPLFASTLPTSLTPAQFVGRLDANAGNVLSEGERAAATDLFGGAGDTSNAAARALALRRVAEAPALEAAEFNSAFVLMQYLGYLRRNPDDPQDTDHTGYDFWLTKLDQFNGNYINAQMVEAFITSIEYRERFGGATGTPTPTPTPTATPTPTPSPTATPTPTPTPTTGAFVVTNANDSGAGSLRQAVLNANAASGANTITFDPSVFNVPQTITLAGSVLTVSDTLTITGPGANLLTVSGNNAVRVFAISPGRTVSISGMKVTQGNGETGAFPGFGGGIYNQGTLTVTNLIVTGNKATIDGGGIYNSTSDTLNVVNCTISNNVADSDNAGSGTGGGGLYSTTGGVLTVTGSTITGNSVGGSAAAGGGGITSYGPTTITNSTVSGNSSGLNGGGIYRGNGTLTITNSTVVNNTAARDGGGVFRNGSSALSVGNTIVANNTDDGTAPDFNGTVNSLGYNLIKNTTGATITGTTTGNLTGVDPNLGPLQDNGGVTPTHALLSGSPAIDKGASLGATTDQRGLPRPFDNPAIPNATGGDGSDIGALEVQQSSASVYEGIETGLTWTISFGGRNDTGGTGPPNSRLAINLLWVAQRPGKVAEKCFDL